MTTDEISVLVGEAIGRDTARAIVDTAHVAGVTLLKASADGETVILQSVSFYPVPYEGPTYVHFS